MTRRCCRRERTKTAFSSVCATNRPHFGPTCVPKSTPPAPPRPLVFRFPLSALFRPAPPPPGGPIMAIPDFFAGVVRPRSIQRNPAAPTALRRPSRGATGYLSSERPHRYTVGIHLQRGQNARGSLIAPRSIRFARGANNDYPDNESTFSAIGASHENRLPFDFVRWLACAARVRAERSSCISGLLAAD